MSISIMKMVWESGPKDQTERLVLLALGDIADDSGLCWPSVQTIADRCCMSERNARRIIRKLEIAGFLSTQVQPGRNSSNRYTVLKPDTAMSARTDDKTGHAGYENRTPGVLKPDTAMSAEPLRTIKNPQQQLREATPIQKQEGLTDRERLLVAMGADPVSGIIGPNGKYLGGSRDMAIAAKWAEVLTIEEQCQIIAERAPKMRTPPGSFAYFDFCIADLVAAKTKPLPEGRANSKQTPEEIRLARWHKLGRKTG